MPLELNAASLQQVIADVRLAIPKALGVGGHAWVVERDDGTPPDDPVECYVKQQRRRDMVAEQEGFGLRDDWVVTAPLNTDLQLHDTISSVGDATLRFLLVDVIPSNRYLQWKAQPDSLE